MRPSIVLSLAALLWPCHALVAQERTPVPVPVRARVEVSKTQSGSPKVTAIVAGWSADTVVLDVLEPDAMRGDTLRVAQSAISSFRVKQSPSLWRYVSVGEITFLTTATVPRATEVAPGTADPFRTLLLVASKDALAGVDPVAGTELWTRKDLPDLKGAELDIVGRSGYGVLTLGSKIAVLDLTTGATRWDTDALSLLSAQGGCRCPAASV